MVVVVEHSSGLEIRMPCFHRGIFHMEMKVQRIVLGQAGRQGSLHLAMMDPHTVLEGAACQEFLHLDRMMHVASHLLHPH